MIKWTITIIFYIIIINFLSIKCNLDEYIANKTELLEITKFKSNIIAQNDEIAVFLLSTFQNAKDLGESNESKHEFFSRVLAAKLTWGLRIQEFYMVTGNGDSESRVLSNGNICTNHTKEYNHNELTTSRGNMEIYKCREVLVLHIPFCSNHFNHPDGPCCRCNAAMNYYLNKVTLYEKYPKWFTFSDDDYYIRAEYLQSILQNFQDKDKPHIIIPFGYREKFLNWNMNPDEYELLPIGDNKLQKYTQYCLWHKDCDNTCAHRCIMSSFGGFNKYAVIKIRESITNFDLHNICKLWQCSHDVGLGMYFYYLAEDAIPIVLDDVIYHLFHTGKLSDQRFYDNILKSIWKDIHRQGDEFDYLRLILFEIEKGRQYSETNQIYQLDGFHTTIFYQTHKNESLSYHTNSYNNIKCFEDSTVFNTWVNDNKKYDPLHPVNYELMCYEYKQYVQSKISLVTS